MSLMSEAADLLRQKAAEHLGGKELTDDQLSAFIDNVKASMVLPVSPRPALQDTSHLGIDWVEVNERTRSYLYQGNGRITFTDVVRIEIRKSGTHRIETAAGIKSFIAPGWLAIQIDTDEWAA